MIAEVTAAWIMDMLFPENVPAKVVEKAGRAGKKGGSFGFNQ